MAQIFQLYKTIARIPILSCNTRDRILFQYCIQTGDFQNLPESTGNLLTRKLVEKYGDAIFEQIDKRDLLKKNGFAHNENLLRHCLKNKRYDDLKKFYSSTFTPDIIEEYGDTLGELLVSDPSKVSNLLHHQELFSFLLKRKNFVALTRFSSDFMNREDFINNYGIEMVDTLPPCGEIPRSFYSHMEIVSHLLDHRRFDLLKECSPSDLPFDWVEKYQDAMIDSLKPYEVIPYAFSDNKEIFLRCLKRGRFDLISQFHNQLFNKSIIQKYGKQILKALPPNDFIDCFEEESSLFWYAIKIGRFDLVPFFNSSLLKENVIYSYRKEIIESIAEDEELPENLRGIKSLFQYCFEHKLYDYLYQFSIDLFTDSWLEENYEEVIEHLPNYSVGELEESAFLFLSCLIRRDFNKANLFNIPKPSAFYDSKYISFFAKKMSLKEEEVATYFRKISYLLSRNEDVLKTLYPEFLTSKMDILDLSDMEKFSLYPELQEILLTLNTNQLLFVSRVLKKMTQEHYDMTASIAQILFHIKDYEELFKVVDIASLEEQSLENLMIVLKRKENVYGITLASDLSSQNFSQKQEKYNRDSYQALTQGKPNLKRMKEWLLETKYGLTLEETDFICKRYCHDMDLLENSNLDKKTWNILKDIFRIYVSQSEEELKLLIHLSKPLHTDFFSTIALESGIRREYARLYNETLYHVAKEDLLDLNHPFIQKHPEVYQKIKKVRYHNKMPQYYFVDHDFAMLVHVLGAYLAWNYPSNYKESWERPLIEYHGICMSYITDECLNYAFSKHPTYGFSKFEESALLCAGNYDLNSDQAISHYTTSLTEPYRFFPPKEMILRTRYSHNEMVLERRCNGQGHHFKRMPDYVLYMVDDMTDLDSFKGTNERFWESVKAAVDLDIPIVLVDRKECINRASEKAFALEEKFLKTLDGNDLNRLLLSWISGASCLAHGRWHESKEFYSANCILDLYHRCVGMIQNPNIDFGKRLEIIDIWKNFLIREKELDQFGVLDCLRPEAALEDLKRFQSAFPPMVRYISTFSRKEKYHIRILSRYFMRASDSEKERMQENFENGSSYRELILQYHKKSNG